MSKELIKTKGQNIESYIMKAGLTPDKVSELLADLMNFTTMKIDKNGNVHESIDGHLRLKAIEIWAKLMGLMGPSGPKKEVHQHLHLNEEELDRLERDAESTRKSKETVAN